MKHFLTMRGIIRKFIRDSTAVAALEFAFLAPLMVLLFVAGGEMAQAIMTARNTDALARALADLTSQQPTDAQTTSYPTPVNATTQVSLEAIMAASSAIMETAPLAPLKMTISAIDITNTTAKTPQCCVLTVRWSYTQNGTLRPCNLNGLMVVSASTPPAPTNITQSIIPPSYALTNGALPQPEALIVADVSYVYQPPLLLNIISFQPSMAAHQFIFPRQYGQVILAGATPPGPSSLPSYTDPSSGSTQTGMVCY